MHRAYANFIYVNRGLERSDSVDRAYRSTSGLITKTVEKNVLITCTEHTKVLVTKVTNKNLFIERTVHAKILFTKATDNYVACTRMV